MVKWLGGIRKEVDALPKIKVRSYDANLSVIGP